MKRTIYTIYTNYDVTSDENMKEARENMVEDMFCNSDEDGTITVMDNYGKEVKLTREEYSKSLTDEKIYYGKCTRKDITRCTRKAGVGIADAFGWTVRGGENKYRKMA